MQLPPKQTGFETNAVERHLRAQQLRGATFLPGTYIVSHPFYRENMAMLVARHEDSQYFLLALLMMITMMFYLLLSQLSVSLLM